MADKKRKSRDVYKHRKEGGGNKKRNQSNSKTLNQEKNKRRTGPHLPNALRKELDLINPTNPSNIDEEEIDSDDANDVYEYEEAIPEEESKRNRRFDPVENLEYELPDQFKDENLVSDDDGEDDDVNGSGENHNGDEVEEEDDGRHARMLQEITGLPSEAFEGKKRKNDVVISEAYPESEYNPSRDVLDGDGCISIQDLLDPLQGKSGFSKLRRSVHRMERKSMSIQTPLPKPDQEKLERKVAYEQSKKDITKWEPLVKRNREAPTLYFDESVDLGFSTVGAIASEFEPRTDFEKKIASLVNDNEVVEAHKKDGARLLELNKISVDDVKDRQNRLAKMRTLLFRHEMKAKRIKKIKSKTFHRLLKKDRLKAVAAEMEMDPEAVKELAMKQEFKRAEERMTLKHKNSSKWAKRILKRGLTVQDEGTRTAISEQLNQHALLTRKMNSMKDNTSSDESSDEDDRDEISAGSDQDVASKLLERAKEKTLEVIEEDDEMPKSGVLSLPFMVRGLKKRKEAADEEAKLALQEYESSLKHLEDKSGVEGLKTGTSSGRWVFGAPKKQVEESSKRVKSDHYYGNSDSEDDFEVKEDIDVGHNRTDNLQKDINIDPDLLREESEIGQDPMFKSFDDIVKDPGPKTTYEVAIFASDSWRKMKKLAKNDNKQMRSENGIDASIKNSSKVVEHALREQDVEEVGDDSDADSEGQMVDGILSSSTKSTYELPSQADLIRRAFVGDDVEDDFEKDKQEILNEENPEPEKPVLLPGWGQWTHIQQKKGLPSWMLEEHENAKKKREETLKKRRDAHLKHVIISEKLDKKAEKLHTKTLPFPYTSKEVFEQSIRMPIGPEFNPATAIGALNRPEVVKKSGVIIKPIKFEDLNPHEKAEEHKRSGEKQKKKSKNSDRTMKKINTKGIKS
uniref:U3 small nucleolar RNA-associated protein 14 n=1 Tax=Davidia involucrata TaxID=16924 RepID=A0A5B7CB94_DAVIN